METQNKPWHVPKTEMRKVKYSAAKNVDKVRTHPHPWRMKK